LTQPGLEFRCHHADRCPTDVCVSVGFESAAMAGSEHPWGDAGWVARSSPTPRLAYVQRRLAAAIATGDRFHMERWGLASLAALEADVSAPSSRGHYAIRPRDVDAVVAVCRRIEADAPSQRSVADWARDVGMTSPQLTRAFRRYLGLSPHAYVLRWRLRTATELLDSGRSVSDTCYSSGFENLSHFCRTFQRTLGVRASLWRTLPLRDRRRRADEITE
jgi:AraC family transcriptional regulator